MLDIRTCIKERKNHILYNAKQDEWIDAINSSELQDEVFFITAEGFLFMLNDKQRDILFERYHLAGVFYFGALYTDIEINMALVHVVSKKISKVKMAVYDGRTFANKKTKPNQDNHAFRVPVEYLPQFNDYIKKIEDWVNNKVFPKPDSEGLSEFNTVSITDVDKNKIYPACYTEKAMEIKELAQKENFVKLSDVADVFMSGTIKGRKEEVKILRPADFSYPLDIKMLGEAAPTKVVLQKGDIVYPTTGSNRAYLYNVDGEEPVYASPTEAVIRCRDILPEYLYFYLNSDIATLLYNMMLTGTVIKRISFKALMELRIAKPKEKDEKYIEDFKVLSTVGERRYSQRGRLQSYYEHLQALTGGEKEPEHIEDILNIEIDQIINAHNEEQLRSFLTEDLKELNICFAHGAYKATLILAGSILEAVLIDWLSEKKHENYFVKDYYVHDKKTGELKRADLRDYINEIKELEKPHWMKEASEAHKIRKKRNLVHAKLCMNEEEGINRETCLKVIGYLRDVIKTRSITYTPASK